MSYSIAPEPQGLGFSLRPPKWLRDAVSGVIHKTTVNVPTPAGGSIPLTPGEIANAIKGSTVTVGPKQPSPVEQAMQNVPGGVGGIALLAGAALVTMLLLRKRRAA